MGQKVNPTLIRLGLTESPTSNWFVKGRAFADYLNEDIEVRNLLRDKLKGAGVSRIQIDRPARNAKIAVYSARPGVIIGKKGNEIESLKKQIAAKMRVPVHLSIEEIRKPELDAYLVAENIAQQLERRVMFRRAMKRAMQTTMRQGALGIKIMISGRLGGAEIARTEWSREGRVPLHTFRADIDYNTAEAHTTYGIIGVKVWIYKGEKHQLAEQPKVTEETEAK